MFERFTGEARVVVISAQEQAREMRDPFLGVEHLLLAMLDGPVRDGLDGLGLGAGVLADHGVTARAIRGQLVVDHLDPDALATLGIDLDEVRRAAEQQFGPGALSGRAKSVRDMPKGHIPFTKRAKKVLEYSVREAVRLGSDRIDSAHLLLGILREERESGGRLLERAGIDVEALRTDAERRAGRQAA